MWGPDPHKRKGWFCFSKFYPRFLPQLCSNFISSCWMPGMMHYFFKVYPLFLTGILWNIKYRDKPFIALDISAKMYWWIWLKSWLLHIVGPEDVRAWSSYYVFLNADLILFSYSIFPSALQLFYFNIFGCPTWCIMPLRCIAYLWQVYYTTVSILINLSLH